MLSTQSSKLIRAALSSKLMVQSDRDLPKFGQVAVKVKAEQSFDPINNVSLLAAITGTAPQLLMINLKKGAMTPRVTLTGYFLSQFLKHELPAILTRAVDKVVAASFATQSHQLIFAFKASDALSPAVRKLGKVFEVEVGLFEVELTIYLNLADKLANETLLRSAQLPIAIV